MTAALGGKVDRPRDMLIPRSRDSSCRMVLQKRMKQCRGCECDDGREQHIASTPWDRII
jgi:hypothetical protein